MGIRSQNNPAASYLDKWVATGTDASAQPAAADGHTASGGTINEFAHPDGYVYRAHTFVNSGTFEVTAVGSIDSEVDYLIVAGGGGGSVSTSGSGTGGTGGAGGGGNANVTHNGHGEPGKENTGGGGGGSPYTNRGGNGGSGVVLIAYPT